MAKIFIFVLLIILAAGSASAYHYLNTKIVTGEARLSSGQKQIDEGARELKAGKAKLAAGKRQLSSAKRSTGFFKAAPLLSMTILPVAAGVEAMASDKIKEGDAQVARGERRVQAGEQQLTLGKVELSEGQQRLKKAILLRMALAVSTFVFLLSALVLACFIWRKTLQRLLKRPNKVA